MISQQLISYCMIHLPKVSGRRSARSPGKKEAINKIDKIGENGIDAGAVDVDGKVDDDDNVGDFGG